MQKVYKKLPFPSQALCNLRSTSSSRISKVLYYIYSILEMATLTIIPYAPKPPNGSIRKPPSKFIARRPSSPDKNLLIDSSDVPVEVLPALGGAARDNNWSQKAVSDNEAAMQDVQVFRDHLVGTRCMCSDHPRHSCHLYLMLYSSLDSREGWFR